MKIELKEEHLKSIGDTKKSVTDIRTAISDQCKNINMILHTNDHWISQVREDQACDPSTKIYSNTLDFRANPEFAPGQKELSEDEAISLMQKSGQWDDHKASCEVCFTEAQNWTRLMSLVQIYESWNGDYRPILFNQVDLSHSDIAKHNKKFQLCLPIFGDLRHIRNNFLHSRGHYKEGNPDKLEAWIQQVSATQPHWNKKVSYHSFCTTFIPARIERHRWIAISSSPVSNDTRYGHY